MLSLALVVMLAFSGLTTFAEDDSANDVENVALNGETDEIGANDVVIEDETYEDNDMVAEDESYEDNDAEASYEREGEEGDEVDSPASETELIEEATAHIEPSTSLIPEIGRIVVMMGGGEERIYLPQGFPLGIALGIFIYDTDDERIGFMNPVPVWMISGLDMSVLGSQMATITLGVHTTTVEVRVVPVEGHVECRCSQPDLHLSVSALGATWEGIHVVGMTLEKADWIAVIECRTCGAYPYSSHVTAEMVSGFDSSTPGTRRVTVTYRGLSYTKEVTFVTLPPETFIEFPDLIPFIFHGVPIERLSLMGTLIIPVEGVEQSQWNRKWFRVTSDMVSGFDPNVIGLQKITVTYLGVTSTLYIEVVYNPYYYVDQPEGGGSNGSVVPGGSGTTTSTPSGNVGGIAPQTGDSLALTFYILLAMGSFGIITIVAMNRRREKRN